ncbi:MAG: glutaredoxin family protein [Nitrospirae bacterium]|nr:glutaredoxin family protein [Nitrospirota bacterium]
MQKPVRIYTLSTCGHCKATKKLLDRLEIKYEFIDVDLLPFEQQNAVLDDVKKYNPQCSFPTIIIGDGVIVGYNEQEIRSALSLK